MLGVFNALVTTLLALPSFVVTLGTLMLYRGVGLALADGKQTAEADGPAPPGKERAHACRQWRPRVTGCRRSCCSRRRSGRRPVP